MLSAGRPGTLFEFLLWALRESRTLEVHEKINPACRHYLVDASWLESNDSTALADFQLVFVCDHFPIRPLPSQSAIMVPSFETLSDETSAASRLRPVVIPPVLEGTNFDPGIPVPRQLTSTLPGVAQTIRQLFVLLDSPQDVPWLGFR